MKRIVLNSIAVLLLLYAHKSFSQVTLLANNTDISGGVVLNGKGFLFADRGDNDSLWTTDGTFAGTNKLTSAVSYVDTGGGAIFNNKIYFTGATAATGAELWVTDGTAGGTSLLKDINTSGNSNPTDFFVYNNTLFFTADNGSTGLELWKSDGTTGGTVLVKDINAGAPSGFSYVNSPNYTVVNGILFLLQLLQRRVVNFGEPMAPPLEQPW